MSNWDDFKFFLALSRSGSLKGAANMTGTDQATVGRRIYALEEELRTKLFEKRSSGFILTLAGKRIKTSIEEVESSFESVHRKITNQDERPEGVIKVAMPGALANHLVIPNLKKFTDQYPKIEIQFFTGAEVLNLAKREADMAFRLVRPQQSDLVVRKIGDISLAFYASKSVLKKYSKINKIEDLQFFPFVSLYEKAQSRAESNLLSKTKKYLASPVISSGAWSSIYYALTANEGIGILPRFMADKNPELEEIIVIPPEIMPLLMVIHPEVQKNKRFVLFSEYIIPIIKSII